MQGHSCQRRTHFFCFFKERKSNAALPFIKKMSGEEQLPTVEEEEKQGDFTGRVFNHCTFTFNADVTFNGNVFMDSYGYRHIGDILQLQELRHQQQSSSRQPPRQPPSGTSSTTATVAPPAPSRSVSAPLFTGSPMQPPSTPSVTQTQSAVLPTPQKTAGKGKGTQKKKQTQAVKPTENVQSKRKEVESAIGPSSEKPRSRKQSLLARNIFGAELVQFMGCSAKGAPQ